MNPCGTEPCTCGNQETACNNCEHGDHAAPAGQRFCSIACQRCEHESTGENGCDGICGHKGEP
ncbi:MAG: hypothetical protein HOW73_17150 [Polyangiaceae bacterium]|nr:hypothetical protein [Polyangiaceae bacterium]